MRKCCFGLLHSWRLNDLLIEGPPATNVVAASEPHEEVMEESKEESAVYRSLPTKRLLNEAVTRCQLIHERPPRVVKPTCDCGLRTTRRIVGGQRALPGEWPWQAGLIVKTTTQIYCGGALINNEWIVTGAHCVTYRNASTLRVVLGEYDVTRHEGIELFRDVDSFLVHPNYHLLTADFDIALVRFKPALNRFSRFISPICLPSANDTFLPGTNCTVTGFGRLAEAGRIATTLQQAVVPIVSRDTCQAAYPDYNITPRMMCAGYASGGIDACQGDQWFVAGIRHTGTWVGLLAGVWDVLVRGLTEFMPI